MRWDRGLDAGEEDSSPAEPGRLPARFDALVSRLHQRLRVVRRPGARPRMLRAHVRIADPANPGSSEALLLDDEVATSVSGAGSPVLVSVEDSQHIEEGTQLLGLVRAPSRVNGNRGPTTDNEPEAPRLCFAFVNVNVRSGAVEEDGVAGIQLMGLEPDPECQRA